MPSYRPAYRENGAKKAYGHVLISQLIRYAAYDLGLQSRYKTFLVFAIIASHADKEGTCFPSIEKMGEKLHVSRQAVSQHVKILKEQKYIFVHHPQGDKNNRRTNLYRLNFKKLDEKPASSLPCGEEQGYQVAVTASSLPCAKKPLNKTELRGSFSDWFNQKIKEQNDYMQEKEYEEKTGVTKQDREELEELRNSAFQGMSVSQRTAKALEVEKAAKEHSNDPKERMAYILDAYKELAHTM